MRTGASRSIRVHRPRINVYRAPCTDDGLSPEVFCLLAGTDKQRIEPDTYSLKAKGSRIFFIRKYLSCLVTYYVFSAVQIYRFAAVWHGGVLQHWLIDQRTKSKDDNGWRQTCLLCC